MFALGIENEKVVRASSGGGIFFPIVAVGSFGGEDESTEIRFEKG